MVTMKIGVLALQGAFAEHLLALKLLGAEGIAVRYREQLDDLDALILPGGESTAITKIASLFDVIPHVQKFGAKGFPVWGTCAGMILMAKALNSQKNQKTLKFMDIEVERNSYGRQKESFEAPLTIKGMQGLPFPGVFIRAPRILKYGTTVEILSHYNGDVVACRQGNFWATSFHPELTGDLRFHDLFIQSLVKKNQACING